jgi:hypothetical protein
VKGIRLIPRPVCLDDDVAEPFMFLTWSGLATHETIRESAKLALVIKILFPSILYSPLAFCASVLIEVTSLPSSVSALSRPLNLLFLSDPIRITLFMGWLLSFFFDCRIKFYWEPLQLFN